MNPESFLSNFRGSCQYHTYIKCEYLNLLHSQLLYLFHQSYTNTEWFLY